MATPVDRRGAARAGVGALGALFVLTGAANDRTGRPEGIRVLASTHGHDATVGAIEREVARRGIRLFATIDQSALGPEAGVPIAPSTLILFGNPAHGLTFLAAAPLAGLDWPVRMLVTDIDGRVTIAWPDFGAIASRYGAMGIAGEVAIADRTATAIAHIAAGVPLP